jgi:4-diphosphocytidyl-2C-methyl-D-erythritol kinase
MDKCLNINKKNNINYITNLKKQIQCCNRLKKVIINNIRLIEKKPQLNNKHNKEKRVLLSGLGQIYYKMIESTINLEKFHNELQNDNIKENDKFILYKIVAYNKESKIFYRCFISLIILFICGCCYYK